MKPCTSCGGTLDIIIDEKQEVIRLRNLVTDGIREQNIIRLELATAMTVIENLRAEKGQNSKEHDVEVIHKRKY